MYKRKGLDKGLDKKGAEEKKGGIVTLKEIMAEQQNKSGLGRAGGVGKMLKILTVRRFMLTRILIRGLDVTALSYAHENKINFLKYLASFIFYGYLKIRIGNHIYLEIGNN